jgi:hypothetical protein
MSMHFFKHCIMKSYGAVKVIAPSFLTSALYGREWSASLCSRFTCKGVTRTHCIGDRVSPRPGMDAVE